ncbi:MAG TPA: hypothetical protein VFW94_00825, partial [Candidatus Acidoferrales bacterium]|nr:hypothetical protein [Candidatus Acidoferrales bacterium]
LDALLVVLFLILIIPEVLRKKVKVVLTPAQGPSPIQLLEVRNSGTPSSLGAECTLLDRRNDPNMLHRSTFRMEWQGPYKRSVKLRRGGSYNLAVAEAGDEVTRNHTMQWMKICGLSDKDEREPKETSKWNRGDTLPEYDLKIRIIGENQKPHVQCFTVRAGKSAALEMFAIPCPKT